MKYVTAVFVLLVTLLLISCGSANSEFDSETSMVNEALQDSLMSSADSLIHAKGLTQGKHLHNGQDLAEKAHQNPKAKRRGIEYKRKRNEGRRRSRIAANARYREQASN